MKLIQSLFDLPFSDADLTSTFEQLHEKYKEELPSWSLSATKRKLIGTFWSDAFRHYLRVLAIGLALSIAIGWARFFEYLFSEIIPAAVIAFLTLVVSLYWKQYYDQFLPGLDNGMVAYQGQHLQGLQQCKKEQYSVLTLMLIEYAERKAADLPELSMNKETVQLLARKYGVSVKSIEKNLQILILKQWERKSIRKRTEIEDDFEAAKDYISCLNIDNDVLAWLRQRMLV